MHLLVVLLFTIVTKYAVNNIHVSRALNSNTNRKNLNLLEPLPETENSSKGAIVLQSNIRSHTAVRSVLNMIILLGGAEIYVLHKLLL